MNLVPIKGSLSREKLRDLRSLDSTRIRRRKGLCVVEGERSVVEAARSGNLLYLVASDSHGARTMIDGLKPPLSGMPLYLLAHRQFEEVSDVRAGSGLLGVAKIPPGRDHMELDTFAGPCFLFYLDGIQEPGNVGALIRTAWALGAGGVLLGEGTADPFSHKGVRASAGGVFHTRIYPGVGEREMTDVMSWGYEVFTAQRGGMDYRRAGCPRRAILALGNEAAGLSKWLAGSGTAVGIPLADGVDSLNVVVAGGIIASRMMEKVP